MQPYRFRLGGEPVGRSDVRRCVENGIEEIVEDGFVEDVAWYFDVFCPCSREDHLL